MVHEFEEPTLRELLDDPIIRLMMASDGVGRDELAELLSGLRPVSRQPDRERTDRAPA